MQVFKNWVKCIQNKPFCVNEWHILVKSFKTVIHNFVCIGGARLVKNGGRIQLIFGPGPFLALKPHDIQIG